MRISEDPGKESRDDFPKGADFGRIFRGIYILFVKNVRISYQGIKNYDRGY